MFNKYEAIGHIVADSVLRYTPAGAAVVEFKVASNYKYGETEEVIFMPCVYFGKGAEAVQPYIKKGTLVFVEGRLKEEKWDSDGITKSMIKTIVSNVKLLSSRDDGAKMEKKAPIKEREAF